MAAVDTASKEVSAVALPGLGRALISAGKLTQKSAEDIYKKSQIARTSFIGELTGSGAVSAADLAHTVSAVFGAPLLDLEAIDPLRLPKELLDPKICQAYRVIVLSKRNNRLIVATADPTDQEAAEILRLAGQMKASLGDPAQLMEYDLAFHTALAKASRNPVYSLLIGSFQGITRQTWPMGWKTRPTQAARDLMVQTHVDMARAVAASDPLKAVELMSLHFDESVRALLTAGMS